MKNIEQTLPEGSEAERRAQLISGYVAKIINEGVSDKDEEKEMREYYNTIGSREKAEELHKKLMAYQFDKQAESARRKEAQEKGETFEPERADPSLVCEIKVLFEDDEARSLFLEIYGESRVDAKIYRLSELGNRWNETRESLDKKEREYKQLEQNVFLGKIYGEGKILSARSKLSRLSAELRRLETRRENLRNLEGLEKTQENTDAAANFQYEVLKKYHRELDEGFMWLPSRKEIHEATIAALQNGRWPVLIGEGGTGKSDQADAAALELTGYPPTEIEGESNTSEFHLIKHQSDDPKTGTYDTYGPLMQAFTGYEDSRETTPKYRTGRICRVDESGRMGDKSYSIFKKTRQKKQGDDFYGHPMLPGAASIWTTNPPGRYSGRKELDPAMRREVAQITVDYPEFSKDNPELYEFMLAALFDKNERIEVAEKELAPYYKTRTTPVDERRTLDDGSVVVAEDMFIEDQADERHGTLWRLAGAIRALQNSFIYGNEMLEPKAGLLLRVKENGATGKEEITKDGGVPFTLSSSTITLGEVASWMRGFGERREKRGENFQTDSFSDWVKFKLETYLKQVDAADREKIEAIFNHFHLLDQGPNVRTARPVTQKEIGYLSPRVPRPLHVEKPKTEAVETSSSETVAPPKEHKTTKVLLEDGKEVLIKNSEFVFEGKKIPVGERFLVDGRSFVFTGVIDDSTSEHDGKLVGKLSEEKELHAFFAPKEAWLGIVESDGEVWSMELLEAKKEIAAICA